MNRAFCLRFVIAGKQPLDFLATQDDRQPAFTLGTRHVCQAIRTPQRVVIEMPQGIATHDGLLRETPRSRELDKIRANLFSVQRLRRPSEMRANLATA